MSKINARNKGNSYERKVKNEWIELGFEDCLTSRHASKYMDDLKVDLINTGPFNIQCKAVEKGVYPHKILEEMPDDSKYNVLFHKKNRQGEVVSMMKEDFYELINMLISNKIIK